MEIFLFPFVIITQWKLSLLVWVNNDNYARKSNNMDIMLVYVDWMSSTCIVAVLYVDYMYFLLELL